jgi:GntR family transcriptional regulator / MocR family aminotransferase
MADQLAAMFAAAHLKLDRDSATLRVQIYRQLREAVMAGRLASGTALPSTRSLAIALGIARSTVVEALDQLRAEGYLEMHQGAATRVAALEARWLDNAVQRAAAQAEAAPVALPQWTNDDPARPRGLRAFRVGLPDIAAFPSREWASHVARRARHPASHDLSYASYCGVDSLRAEILRHAGQARHVQARAEQVIVLPSARAAFDIVARLSLGPGDNAWIEDPGYYGIRALLQAHRARIVPVPVDAEGMAPGAVRARPKLIYVTPSHQSPTGVTMSLRRRLELLETARRAGANIVEDDYDSEFRYRDLPIASLQGLDRHGSVHYVGTFSKPLAPGLHVAYLIVPPRFVELATTIATITGAAVPVHMQLALADFMADGGLRRHIRAMLPRYEQRITRLASVLSAEGAPWLNVPQPQGGLQLCVGLDERIDDVALAAALLTAGIVATPVSQLCIAARLNGLHLGIGAVRDDEVEPAARELCAVLRRVGDRRASESRALQSSKR